MNLLDAAIKERKILSNRLDILNQLIASYNETDGNEHVEQVHVETHEPASIRADFPKAARKEEQIEWLFENVIKRAVKIREIQQFYNEVAGKNRGKEVKIDMIVRLMKKDRKTTTVKYNHQNTLCYWGLPQWLDSNKNNSNYKEEFMPSDENMPDVNFSEVI